MIKNYHYYFLYYLYMSDVDFNEDVIIDMLPSIKEVMPVIKQIIENTTMVVNVQESNELEAVIEAFDNIK